MFAQVNQVAPDHLKDVSIILLALLGAAGTIAAIVFGVLNTARKGKPQPTSIQPQPLEVTAATRFATVETCHQAHVEVTRRLDGHDADIRAIYEELKDDRDKNEVHASSRAATLHGKIDAVRTELDSKMDRLRVEVSKGFQDTERNIGKLEGLIQKLRDGS